MKTVEIPLPQVASDVEAVVDVAKKVDLFTPKRLIIAAGVTCIVVGAVFVTKKIKAVRAAAAEEEFERA